MAKQDALHALSAMRDSVSLVAWRWHAHFYFAHTVVVLGHYLCHLYFFRDFSRAVMLTPNPSIETPFTATCTKNSLLLCVHCIFKKQKSELKKVNGVIFFSFLVLSISESLLWKIAGSYSLLYGMNRKLSQRLFWSLFVYSSFLPFSFLVLRWFI